MLPAILTQQINIKENNIFLIFVIIFSFNINIFLNIKKKYIIIEMVREYSFSTTYLIGFDRVHLTR